MPRKALVIAALTASTLFFGSSQIPAPGAEPVRRDPHRLAAVGPTDWPAYGRTSGHASTITGDPAITTANAGSLSPSWSFLADAATEPNQPARRFDASPTVVGNRVYIGSRTGMFYVLDADTGGVIWKKQLDWGSAQFCPAKGIVGTASVANDPVDGVLTVYVSGAHFLYALNAATGAQRWKRSIGPNTSAGNGLYFNWASPTVQGRRIFVGLAANCESNADPWRRRLDQPSHRCPATHLVCRPRRTRGRECVEQRGRGR